MVISRYARDPGRINTVRSTIVVNLSILTIYQNRILNHICVFIRGKLARNKAMRVIYSRADGGKIAEYRENLNAALQKFEVRTQIKLQINCFV